ncbi:high mobility group box domain-containing protein, partial [Sporodiniella umbellata]
MIEISEEDFGELKVKLGHRRLIQKALRCLTPANTDIMQFYGKSNFYQQSTTESSGYGSLPSNTSFLSTLEPPSATAHEEGNSFSEEDSPPKTYCRKYRRHPKPDPQAPIKPLSAYVLFSNHTRAELKEQQLSFVELAKIVGHRWKHLAPHLKRKYELSAIQAREEYARALIDYQQTPAYRAYQDYQSRFKKEQQEENKRIMRQRKKFKSISSNSSSLKRSCRRL